MNNIKKSIKLFEEAKLHMPGGVNSPVRAFKNIDGNPIFFKKAKGAYVYDADDNKYIDYIADSTKEKIGKFTPGTHIPIKDIKYFRKNYPDIAILNSWNHKTEIFKKEHKFRKKGGKWISHVK